jgi:PEP-CTERM putative exosortase interaction domain
VQSAYALPVTLSDPYGGQNNAGHSNGDVIGDLSRFDIESLTITQLSASGVTGNIRFNYNLGDATLSPFALFGTSLQVGDLLFSLGGTYKYGVALVSHDGLLAGKLYSILGTKSSDDYLGASGLTYRNNTPVRINPTGAVIVGDGTITTQNVGGYELETTFNFTPSASFLVDLHSSVLGVQFESAICANDIVQGSIPATSMPEPSTWFLFATGLLGLLWWRKQRGVA